MQLYDRWNCEDARGKLIAIVRHAGDVGFETLVRALAKTDQKRLARLLDEQLAERYIRKPSAIARMSLSLLSITLSISQNKFIYSAVPSVTSASEAQCTK